MNLVSLVLQHAPHNLLRVGIEPGRTVYLPIEKETLTAARMGRNGESVWCDGATEIYVSAYVNRLEIRIVTTPARNGARLLARANAA